MRVDIKRLAELAKLNIDGADLAIMEQDMASIIALMDTIKDVELPLEDEEDDAVSMLDLRKDVVGESLQGCKYDSIPKVVE